ncbi:hypothetical protein PR048_029667 [Dryococelus australis]|uniref:Uncharacterized protein n=1 Tax=Dryococelus australis TaxID=614101 RepID=A0ABQ9GGD2_9NEOP|nr:hypothetical protein PR048_029667 [Dryococelus australis]
MKLAVNTSTDNTQYSQQQLCLTGDVHGFSSIDPHLSIPVQFGGTLHPHGLEAHALKEVVAVPAVWQASVVQWSDYSSLSKVNCDRLPVGSLMIFRTWESCRTKPLVVGFSRGLPFPSPLHSNAAPYSPSSGLKTPMLLAYQISQLHFDRTENLSRLRHQGAIPRPSVYKPATLSLSHEGKALSYHAFAIKTSELPQWPLEPRSPDRNALALMVWLVLSGVKKQRMDYSQFCSKTRQKHCHTSLFPHRFRISKLRPSCEMNSNARAIDGLGPRVGNNREVKQRPIP